MIHTELDRGPSVANSLLREPRGGIEALCFGRNIPQGHGERVLVVENDPAIRLSITRALAQLGYSYSEACDSRGAIAWLQSQEPFEVMICDMDLPHLSGRRLAQIARARRPLLRVLLLVGSVSDDANVTMDGVQTLTKSFTLSSFAHTLRRLIQTPVFSATVGYLHRASSANGPCC